MATEVITESVAASAATPSTESLIDFTTYEKAWRSAKFLSQTELCPKDCRGKPADIILRVEFGKTLGLTPLQSLSHVASINGRPTVWGDMLLALCQNSSSWEDIEESIEETKEGIVATCWVKRKNQKGQTRRFTQKQAQQAGLWDSMTWKKWPHRMLQMKARNWALRDVFADVLANMSNEDSSMAAEGYIEVGTPGEGTSYGGPSYEAYENSLKAPAVDSAAATILQAFENEEEFEEVII